MAIRMIYIGRRVPKGFRELPGAVHIGKGIWIIPMERIVAAQSISALKARELYAVHPEESPPWRTAEPASAATDL